MNAAATGTVVVIGTGPGLGMSIAHRFGREGRPVALVSRDATRHQGYVRSLADAGVKAEAFAADVRGDRLPAVLEEIAERLGAVEVLYYGAFGADPASAPTPILDAGSDRVRSAMDWLYPAVDTVRAVLPGMIERGTGGLLFAGGLSSVVPMPALGELALVSAALRNYALTLNAALTDRGVYAGTLTIGGLVERGDIHAMVKASPDKYGNVDGHTLDPDDIAATAWNMYTARDRAEAVFNALAP
ncbi:SDR family NAD(P)-dependent oxidoreductase [Spirillospora sp. NPDC047279]|uniref:SDR family NAD(P)-dependent oxidoreductase n=1 Tax=Spirillospora sp. NPDC047279 TaxID=3155478 RepID=UPI00340BBC9B